MKPPIKFVLDVHLGKLAYHLRMLGYDTLYRNDYTDESLQMISKDEERVLLSRDRALIEESNGRGSYVNAIDPKEQLMEVLDKFRLEQNAQPFTRCLLCNAPLEQVGKEAVSDRLPPIVRETYEEFLRCPSCSRIYWKGSHYDRMTEFIEQAFATLRSGRGEKGE